MLISTRSAYQHAARAGVICTVPCTCTQYARHRAARVTADRRNKEYAAFPTNAIRAPAFSGIPVKRGTYQNVVPYSRVQKWSCVAGKTGDKSAQDPK
jgi:hypothetical protein